MIGTGGAKRLPTDFKTISPPFIVSHSRLMGLYEIPEYKPCQLVQLSDILLRSTDENRWLVSNDVPVDPPNILDIGSCYYQVDNAFLFPSESDVMAKIDFSITRYLVANGSFESRLKFWNSVGNYTEVAPSFTNDGAYSARLRVDSGHRGAVTSIYQDIRIPSVSDDVVLPPGARLKLQFFYKVEYNSNRPDENLGSYIPSTFLAYMAISEVDPFPLEGEIAIDSDFEGIANEIIRDDDVSLASAFGNLVGRADVTRFVGEIVRLSFSVIRGDNGSERVSVFIDDVHFDLCSDIAGSGLDPCNFAPEPIQ